MELLRQNSMKTTESHPLISKVLFVVRVINVRRGTTGFAIDVGAAEGNYNPGSQEIQLPDRLLRAHVEDCEWHWRWQGSSSRVEVDLFSALQTSNLCVFVADINTQRPEDAEIAPESALSGDPDRFV
jgi:hypothetical protein